MEKGARVKVTQGRKAIGTTGTVFWIGEDKYREGSKRLGIHGDDGETHWISADNVEETTETPPEVTGPEPTRGDRVAWKQGGQDGHGEIFWVGPNKHGPGFRVGVNCDDGETRWLDARQTEPAPDSAAPTAAAPPDRDEPPPMDALPDFDDAPPPTDGPPPEIGEPPPMAEPPPPEGGPPIWDDEEPPF